MQIAFKCFRFFSYPFEGIFLKLIDIRDDDTNQEVDNGNGAEEHESQQEDHGEALAVDIILKIPLNSIIIKLA